MNAGQWLFVERAVSEFQRQYGVLTAAWLASTNIKFTTLVGGRIPALYRQKSTKLTGGRATEQHTSFSNICSGVEGGSPLISAGRSAALRQFFILGAS